MSTNGFSFRPARREGVHLIVMLAGGTGSGKTYSALRLATGLAGGGKIAVIDTEAGRAKHYAEEFGFEHGDLLPPFRPERYMAAIEAAEAAGFAVVIVDSGSHEHAGEGGLLEWHDEILAKMAGGDERRREACNMRAWVEPKTSHKRMVSRLLQLRAHLIVCLRAEPKVRIEKDPRTGKTVIVDAGWQPVVEKNLPFEATASFLLSHEAPGATNSPLKLPEGLRPAFGPRIDEDCGKRLLAWAAGGARGTATASAASEQAGVEQFVAAIETITDQGALIAHYLRHAEQWRRLPADEATEIQIALDARAKTLGMDGIGALRRTAKARSPVTTEREPGLDSE